MWIKHTEIKLKKKKERGDQNKTSRKVSTHLGGVKGWNSVEYNQNRL